MSNHPDTEARAFIRLTGEDCVSFLQGILTNDITKLRDEKIQFAALLSPQGKILHDMFLIADGDSTLIDTAAIYKDTLLKRLNMYKLRAKVAIEEVNPHDSRLTAHDSLPDPRHPELPPRMCPSLRAERSNPANENLVPQTRHAGLLRSARNDAELGILRLGRDFEPDTLTALDAGYDLLHAISFTKGCYVGQEVTARMHYKNIARRGFFILERDGKPEKLALLKFDEAQAANFHLTVDNIAYHARLPAWMQPKWEQWLANQ